MNVLCISASNVKRQGSDSISTKVCNMIKDIIISKYNPEAQINVMALMDYELKPCIMCAECSKQGECIYDKSFNNIYSAMKESDAVFVVVPHYAPIPSKLIMLLEKLEELAYIGYCVEESKKFTLYKKPIGIIAHGGQTGDVNEIYSKALLDPLGRAFLSVQMDVIGTEEGFPRGATFGITGMKESENSILPDMVHNYEDIKKCITPLINKVIEKIQ